MLTFWGQFGRLKLTDNSTLEDESLLDFNYLNLIELKCQHIILRLHYQRYNPKQMLSRPTDTVGRKKNCCIPCFLFTHTWTPLLFHGNDNLHDCKMSLLDLSLIIHWAFKSKQMQIQTHESIMFHSTQLNYIIRSQFETKIPEAPTRNRPRTEDKTEVEGRTKTKQPNLRQERWHKHFYVELTTIRQLRFSYFFVTDTASVL